MTTESATALSRSPTPTLPSNDSLDANSDNEVTTSTDISSNSDGWDYDDDDILDRHYYLNNALWTDLVTSLNAITKSSTDASVGTSTTSLRKYYIRNFTELSNRPEYDVPFTTPPCPHITIIAVDHKGQDDDARIECPCCLPDDLPRLELVAEDIAGGVVTYKVVLRRLATWLYGPDQEEPLGLGQESALGQTVEGLPAGEAGIVRWNIMVDDQVPDLGDAIMGLQLFLYFSKPLVGGGRFRRTRE